MNEIRMKRRKMQIDFHFSEARKLSLDRNKPNLNITARHPMEWRVGGALLGRKYKFLA